MKCGSVILLSVMLTAFVPTVAMADDTQNIPSKTTQAFVQTARTGNQFKVIFSRLALKNSRNDIIRQFAQQMIEDMVGKLNQLSGADFDHVYVTDQVAAHDEAAKLFSDYAQNGDDQPLKDFAAKTLPVIREHQQHIHVIRSSFPM